MTLIRLLTFMLLAVSAILPAIALPTGFHASSSRLASGKWAKVSVKETGMHFVSNSTLKNLGFADPSKVNVYGSGGRVLPERLYSGMTDDLPPVHTLHTPTGIVFYGVSTVSWEKTSDTSFPFKHTGNPYSDISYYFLSDIASEQSEMPAAESAVASGTPVSTFTERLVHEQDLLAPAESGRLLLGEDFRTQPTRTFNFSLPGNLGDVSARICFGTKVTGGISTLTFTANGKQLASNESDRIPGVSNSESIISLRTITKKIEAPGEKLTLGIKHQSTGAQFTAALDWIEIAYERQLRLSGNELLFSLSPSQASAVNIGDCSTSTVVWDVTDPAKIRSVETSLTGSTLTFTTPKGYREYIAFNPSGISRVAAGAGAVANQDLHSTTAPGMLVIAPAQFMTQARKIADLHMKHDGLDVLAVTPEQVYNEFSSGVPDLTAFRKLLKMWHDRKDDNGGEYTRYCLIMSRPSYDVKGTSPAVKRAGYPRIPIWQSEDGLTESSSYSTDDYIGMLDDNPGTLNMGSATIHTAVGRMPVKSVAEAETAVAKLENYLLNPNLGQWRNNVMVIADDQDSGEHLDQAEKVVEAMQASDNGSNLIYEKLYLDAYQLRHSGSGPVYPEAKERMLDKISEGVSLLDYIGHGSPRSWGHEGLLTWTDVNSFSNSNLPFIYAATCEFLYWDADEVSGGEVMWLNPSGGVIGMICPSRKVYISTNGVLNHRTAQRFFAKDSSGMPLRLGQIMVDGKNACPGETNKLRYCFMGDPAMRLPYPSFHLAIDEINGIDPSGDTAPELKSRSKVTLSGSVRNPDGSLADGFSGTLRLQLYDAERVVETYGNGDKGEKRTYNDRKTRLFTGSAKITDGLWSTSFIMPSEIENNYSPALLSLYAWDAEGREANGGTDRLYVYGAEENPLEDSDGPSITGFCLNSISFSDGDAVGPSPVLKASLSDPSGINLSEAGIGHAMTVSLDGKQWFDDVNLYYEPDTETFEKGTVEYPLSNVEPGDHTLTLTVWDTANNSSSATLAFTVRASWSPGITRLSTDVSPATTSVAFTVGVDGCLGIMPCRIEVFDLGGKPVWTSQDTSFSGTAGDVTVRWDLRDSLGRRVPRGIYLYRATVSTSDGREVSKTNKLAVAAPN